MVSVFKWCSVIMTVLVPTTTCAQEIWSKSSLARLSTLDRQTLVLCVRGTVATNFEDTVAHNFAVGGTDATWALKVSAHESKLMSDLAKDADWAEIREYYRTEAENSAELIRGNISMEQYRQLSKENERILGRELSRLERDMSAVENSMNANYSLCQSIAGKLIGTAKIRASN